MFREHHHDHEDDERERQLTDVVTYMVRTYCHGMGIDETVITVHAHEDGAVRDRMLTLHVATGPDSAARLAVQASRVRPGIQDVRRDRGRGPGMSWESGPCYPTNEEPIMRYTHHPIDGAAITLDDLRMFLDEMTGYRELPGTSVVRGKGGAMEVDFDSSGPRLRTVTVETDNPGSAAHRPSTPGPRPPRRGASDDRRDTRFSRSWDGRRPRPVSTSTRSTPTSASGPPPR